jgi:hypothetical protein
MFKLEVSIRRRHLYALVGLVAALALIIPTATWAADKFTDVPDSNIFHDDITWLADAGVTLGCNPPTNDKFCPGSTVTREQMAAFMRRLADNQVVDAKSVEGKAAAALESHAYETTLASNFAPPASATSDVLTLDLPAGTYLIQARAGINSNMGSPGGASTIVCDLTAGAKTQDVRNLFLNTNGLPGETQYASWLFTHTFATAGDAVLSCTTQAAWSGNILSGASLTAISVQSASIQAAAAAAAGDTPDNE